MNEYKDQVDAAEREKLQGLVKELRDLAVKGQAGDTAVTAEAIKEAIDKAQGASLTLFQKVYEKKAAEASGSKDATPEAEEIKEEPKEKKD